ncbi:unnamed protein product [Pleuronectes platessa]|uniref:Uncharacterized protein n=1 Tax=Pleuronectes platessa TaxID=8262 RepID=A0A9N7VV06_PLEPL|nr:unnamed protein product [Pleuronectes platessa]
MSAACSRAPRSSHTKTRWEVRRSGLTCESVKRRRAPANGSKIPVEETYFCSTPAPHLQHSDASFAIWRLEKSVHVRADLTQREGRGGEGAVHEAEDRGGEKRDTPLPNPR